MEMMLRLIFLVLLLSAVGLDASETAAWRIPIDLCVPGFQTRAGVRKLDEPPGTSAFFQKGDQLWDLSKSLRWSAGGEDDPFTPPQPLDAAAKWSGDWIAWNERSHQVVARGSWKALREAEEALGYTSVPVLSRSKFELVTGEAGAATRSFSLISHHGDEARARIAGGDLKVTFTEASAGVIIARWQADWKAGPEDSGWSVNAAITLEDNRRMLIARHGQAAEKWEIFGTVTLEHPDGTPVNETRWLEYPDGPGLWCPFVPSSEVPLRSLGGGLLLGLYPVPVDFPDLVGTEYNRSSPVKIPQSAAEWVQGQLFPAKELLKANGINVAGAGTFAAFDPKGRLIIIADTAIHDLVRQITDSCCGRRPVSALVETNLEAGGWGLSCQSGEKAAISRTFPGSDAWTFEIEPTLGRDGGMVDLRYKVDLIAGNKVGGRVEAASTFVIGKPQQVGSFESKGSSVANLVLTVGKAATR